MSKIVILIRALSSDYLADKIYGSHEITSRIQLFNEVSRIPYLDFRKTLHDIQLANFEECGIAQDDIIFNITEDVSKATDSNCPFVNLQKSVLDKIMQLDDDCLILPTDDDDWFSPKILHHNFDHECLNMWSVARVFSSKKVNYKSVPEAESINFEECKGNLEKTVAISPVSNGYAIPAAAIKRMITSNDLREAHNSLLKHCTLRFHNKNKMHLRERIEGEVLSFYVTHCANISRLVRFPASKEGILDFFKAFLRKDYGAVELPVNLLWVKKYLDLLDALHKEV